MTTTNYYLNGSPINPPRNWKELAFQVNFDRGGNAKVKAVSENFEFVRENAQFFTNYINGSTPGILVAPSLSIEIARNGVIERPYDAYIDLTKDAEFSPESVNVKATELKSIEDFESKIDGFGFDYLLNIGVISKDDYKFIPYVINSVPDYKESAIAIITAYVVYEQIRESIQKVKELAAELSNPMSAISAVLKAALLAAYLITLIAALVKLIKDIVQLIIQPVKYHACMNVKTLLEKGCSYLGLTLSSSILSNTAFSKAYIMPEKSSNPVNADDKRILGFTIPKKLEQNGYFKGTFGDLVRAILTTFNMKLVIRGATVYFERTDFNITAPQYTLPDLYQPVYKTNANEAIANYLLSFQTDTLDKNTLQEYTGTSYQVILSPITNVDQDLNMLKGYEEVRFPFALAKRKTELTVPEKIIKAFLDALSIIVNALISAVNALISLINSVISVINKFIKALATIGIKIKFQVQSIPSISFVNLGNLIENRLNMMKLETDFTSVPKIFLMDLGVSDRFNKLSQGNETYFSANHLWHNFHYVKSWLPTPDRPFGNQCIIKEFDGFRFGFEDYQNVKDCNTINAFGQEAIVQGFGWNSWEEKAQAVEVRIPTLLTTNIKANYFEPNGR